jgi:hypothetical protein
MNVFYNCPGDRNAIIRAGAVSDFVQDQQFAVRGMMHIGTLPISTIKQTVGVIPSCDAGEVFGPPGRLRGLQIAINLRHQYDQG